MPRVLLIHWNPAEAVECAARLREQGFETSCFADPRNGAGLRAIRENPPDAIVIDLARLPSCGREAAIFLRAQKATRNVPLVFIEGDPEKTARVRGLLPDAIYTTWPRIGAALSRASGAAIRAGAAVRQVPTFAAYAGTPLARKLRIREGSVVALAGAPDGFERKLDPLPAGARINRRTGDADVILAFVESAAALGRDLPRLARDMCAGRTLWLIWPKKTSALAGGLGQAKVRKMGLGEGLVDYKICAVDETWSGLAFARRARPPTDGAVSVPAVQPTRTGLRRRPSRDRASLRRP